MVYKRNEEKLMKLSIAKQLQTELGNLDVIISDRAIKITTLQAEQKILLDNRERVKIALDKVSDYRDYTNDKVCLL
jgi:hypothetical protein